MIEDFHKNSNIKLLGRVEGKKLIELYSTAVLSFNAASLPEVLGEVALFFDSYSVDDLKENFLQILYDDVLLKERVCKGE